MQFVPYWQPPVEIRGEMHLEGAPCPHRPVANARTAPQIRE